MTLEKINELKEKGLVFIDIEYDDFIIYHDISEDKYYLYSQKDEQLSEVYLAVEKRYTDESCLNDEDLCNDSSIDFDIGGEFDEPIETVGAYIWRYGYFKFVNPGMKIPVTQLIELF